MAQRCEAEHPIKTWPYVKRCVNSATRFKVEIPALCAHLDLCERDYNDYLDSLPIEQAGVLHQKHGKDTELLP